MSDKDANRNEKKLEHNKIELTSKIRKRIKKRFNVVKDEQRELAICTLYDKCQVIESTFKNYVNQSSTNAIDWDTLYNIANGLNCSTDYLLCKTDNPDDPHSMFIPEKGGFQNVTQPLLQLPTDGFMFKKIAQRIKPQKTDNYDKELLKSIYSLVIADNKRFINNGEKLQLLECVKGSFICKDYNYHDIDSDKVIQLIDALRTINKDTIDIILSSRKGYNYLFSGQYHTALINTFDLLLYCNIYHGQIQHPLFDCYVQTAYTIVKTLFEIAETDSVFLSTKYENSHNAIAKILKNNKEFIPNDSNTAKMFKYFYYITYFEASKKLNDKEYEYSLMLYLKFMIFYLQTVYRSGVVNLYKSKVISEIKYNKLFIDSLVKVIYLLNEINANNIASIELLQKKYIVLYDVLTKYDLTVFKNRVPRAEKVSEEIRYLFIDYTNGIRDSIYEHLDSLIQLNSIICRYAETDREKATKRIDSHH